MFVEDDFATVRVKMKPLVLLTLFCVEMQIFFCQTAKKEILRIENLSPQCLRCLCHAATECDLTRDCIKGYCGPYKISRVYWKDAGEETLPDDDKERAGAFEDCTFSYPCAQSLVINYMAKYGRDCNEDGVTDCVDFMMINFNGGTHCHLPLNRSDVGKEWLQRFHACDPRSS